jgi:hypothetical protein
MFSQEGTFINASLKRNIQDAMEQEPFAVELQSIFSSKTGSTLSLSV